MIFTLKLQATQRTFKLCPNLYTFQICKLISTTFFMINLIQIQKSLAWMLILISVQRFLWHFMSKFIVQLQLFIMRQAIFLELEECDMSLFEPHQIGEEKESLETIASLSNVNQKMKDFRHWVLLRYIFFLHSTMMMFYIPVCWCVGLKLMVIDHIQRLGMWRVKPDFDQHQNRVCSVIHIRVVHSSHSWAIFGSFLSIWQRNKQKVAKNGIQNDVKNVYHECSGKENLEKWWENAFFLPGTAPKWWKMIKKWITSCKSKVRVPFFKN